MKQIPTLKEIRDNILSDIKTELYSDKAQSVMLVRSVWFVFATVYAAVLKSCYEFARYMYRQIFTSTADEESLELRGQQYGIYRKKGKNTVFLVKVKGEAFAEIPQNSQLIHDDYIYLTKSKTKLDIAGEGKAEIISTIIGNDTILPEGETLTFISPIANIDSNAVVEKTIEEGEEEEAIETLRNRIQTYERTRPQGGAVPDFILWTTEVPEIADAMILRATQDDRTVTVYPIADESTGSRIPDEKKLQEVLDYVSDEKRCPPCIVKVKAPVELTIDITVRNLSPFTDASKTKLENAWSNFLKTKKPKQYTNDNDVDNLIDKATLISTALLNDIRTLDIDSISIVDEPSVSVPYVLKIGELVKLGTVTYV